MLDGQLREELACAVEDIARDAGEARNVDAVAAIGAAFDDAVEEDDLVFPFADGDVEVADAFEALGQVGELVIMRRE